MIKLYAFRWVPDFARGYVRDLRVRWALEESGIPYETVLISQEEKQSDGYRAIQPFAQVPAIDEDGRLLFESGAIVLEIARRSTMLMPADVQGRARTEAWMFAALNSVEPVVGQLGEVDIFAKGERWAEERRPGLIAAIEQRLDQLQTWLGDRDHLEGRFTAGDLLMADVLRNLDHTDLIDRRPGLKAYRDRCTARPAFRKAMADQLASFENLETVG
jgi:glutathione S-transferase